MRFPLFSTAIAATAILVNVFPASALSVRSWNYAPFPFNIPTGCVPQESTTSDSEVRTKESPNDADSPVELKLRLYDQRKIFKAGQDYCGSSEEINVNPGDEIPSEVLQEIFRDF